MRILRANFVLNNVFKRLSSSLVVKIVKLKCSSLNLSSFLLTALPRSTGIYITTSRMLSPGGVQENSCSNI